MCGSTMIFVSRYTHIEENNLRMFIVMTFLLFIKEDSDKNTHQFITQGKVMS